ncbi:MAG: entericidin, EcnA/B family [Betaproteobacteria bacterium]|nr:MAG: entericidin, EcnA/B family [Betaproteobacteria bacterium]
MPKKFIVLIAVKLALIAVGVGVVVAMYGCNTVEGIGRDLQQAGQVIEKEAAKK